MNSLLNACNQLYYNCAYTLLLYYETASTKYITLHTHQKVYIIKIVKKIRNEKKSNFHICQIVKGSINVKFVKRKFNTEIFVQKIWQLLGFFLWRFFWCKTVTF